VTQQKWASVVGKERENVLPNKDSIDLKGKNRNVGGGLCEKKTGMQKGGYRQLRVGLQEKKKNSGFQKPRGAGDSKSARKEKVSTTKWMAR